ncbi:MAG: lysostaphin resistance A-like protein [Candidatus Scalindua sp.]
MINKTPFSRHKLLILTALAEGVVLIVALLIAWYFGIKLFPLSQKIFYDIVIGTLGALIPLALFVFLLSEKANNIPLLGSLKKTITNDIRVIFSDCKLIDLCFISVCAGFAEELLFRGVIQVKLGIISASIIFGLLHFITPTYCIIATIMGFYLGFLFQYYESILIPIQLHFVYDLGALIYLRYFYFDRS